MVAQDCILAAWGIIVCVLEHIQWIFFMTLVYKGREIWTTDVLFMRRGLQLIELPFRATLVYFRHNSNVEFYTQMDLTYVTSITCC